MSASDELASDSPINSAIKKFPIQDFTFERDSRVNMSAVSFAVIGSSKSGKTTFCKYLLKKHFADDIKVLFTQSLHNDIYDGMKKDMIVAPGYIPDVIRATYNINKKTGNHYGFMHVIDDVVGCRNDKEMSRLLCLYRNSRIGALVVGQDYTLLNANGRANVNYVCIFYSNTDSRCEDNIKMFLRSYFPRSLNMDQKIALLKKLTENHCFLFIDNLNNTVTRCKLKPSQMVD